MEICYKGLDFKRSDKHTRSHRKIQRRSWRKICAKKREKERKRSNEINDEKTDKLAFGILLTLRDRSGNHLFLNVIMIVKKSAYSVGFWLKFSEQRNRKEKRKKNQKLKNRKNTDITNQNIEEKKQKWNTTKSTWYMFFYVYSLPSFGIFVIVFNIWDQVTVEYRIEYHLKSLERF